MEGWVAASLYLSDGRIVRFGPDEEDTGDIPTSVSFDTNNPGGFGAASLTLPRPPDLFADDGKLFSHVEVYGPGTTTYYEGMVVGVPQVGAEEIELQLSGWSSVLDRVQTFREIYVDRDLSRWGEASRARRLAILATFFNSFTGPSVESDSNSALPALTLTAPAGRVNPYAAAWYDAGAGLKVAAIYYDMTSLSLSTYGGDLFVAANDEAGGAAALTSDLLTGTNSSASGLATAASPKRYALIRFYLGGTVGSKDQSMTVRRLAVFGDHGLTKRGTAPDQGFYASDVIADALNSAPDLNYTAGDSIEATSFVIPHLTFLEDTSLRSVVEQLTSLGGNQNVANDWGVYEGRQFYWRSPGTYGRTWYVRKDDVATSASDGPDADRRVAGVKVNYTDGSGASKSVGPPDSNADYETSDLLDSDPDNPAHRIQGAYASETVGITSQQGAVNIGVMILNERNRLDWRGSVEVTGEAQDANGNTYSSALVRAGDRIVISDAADTTPRTIIGTSYDHETMTTKCDIGAHPDSLEALLGQLALVTDLIGQ